MNESSIPELTVIGGGLAGAEAAWQAARRGVRVRLYEMRPGCDTPAHKTDRLAELVCSNSFRGDSLQNAVGLLKEELRRGGSLIMEAASETRVPAGGALAVDRELFSGRVTEAVLSEPLIEVVRREVEEIGPEGGLKILATGPLTSGKMAAFLQELTGRDQLYFYDAIAPIIDAETIDMDRVYRASRYGRGGDDYLNCPMTEDEYERFYQALLSAEKTPVRTFEKEKVFEGCMPIEVLASRGRETPVFGPMKPVGLADPRTGREPFAVVQLRAENRHGTAYNMVGFQTRLKWPEQKRVFRMIPGLENSEFLRLGSLHRNTFVVSPLLLDKSLRLKKRPDIMLAGQITGVEGYVESTAIGWLAGVTAARLIKGMEPLSPPAVTAHGGLVEHITATEPGGFQPSNVNFGMLPPLEVRVKRKRERYEKLSVRALSAWEVFLQTVS